MGTPVLSVAHVLWAFGIGSAYALWPIIGKYSQASGAWVTTMVIIGSLLSGVSLAYPSMTGHPLPDLKAFALLLAAGAINGAAVYFYSAKAVDPSVPTCAFVITTVIVMIIMTPLFCYMLNGETISLRQTIGLGTAILTVLLLAG